MTEVPEFREILKYITFMNIAKNVGSLSYDKKYEVGSILVKNDFKDIASIGYNGNFSGGLNMRDSDESGKSGFIHAETNMAIKTKLHEEYISQYYTVFVTLSPCEMCAKNLINLGVKRVIYLEKYWDNIKTIEYFNKSGVSFISLREVIEDLYLKSPLLRGIGDVNDTSDVFLSKQLEPFLEISSERCLDIINQFRNENKEVSFYNILINSYKMGC